MEGRRRHNFTNEERLIGKYSHSHQSGATHKPKTCDFEKFPGKSE